MNYIERFMDNPEHEYYILCRDARDQENKRISLFHHRKKMGSMFESTIGITKKDISGQLYVVLFKKDLGQGFRMINGQLVPDIASEQPAEKDRMVRLMREDGVSEDEIQEILKEG